jgi:lysophospholipase L1-like esterase
MTPLLCFGDSITYGELDEIGGGWVNRLKCECLRRILVGRSPEVFVHALGLPGETTAGLRARFEAEFATRVVDGDLGIALFAYGATDAAVREGEPVVPLADFLDNLVHCIRLVRGRGARTLLVDLPPIAREQDGRPGPDGSVRSAETIARYNAALAALAADTGAHLIDIHTPLARARPGWLRPDGVHPNHEGHRRIFEIVLPEVDALLGRRRAR